MWTSCPVFSPPKSSTIMPMWAFNPIFPQNQTHRYIVARLCLDLVSHQNCQLSGSCGLPDRSFPARSKHEGHMIWCFASIVSRQNINIHSACLDSALHSVKRASNARYVWALTSPLKPEHDPETASPMTKLHLICATLAYQKSTLILFMSSPVH